MARLHWRFLLRFQQRFQARFCGISNRPCKLLTIPQRFESPEVYTPRNRAWNCSKKRQCKWAFRLTVSRLSVCLAQFRQRRLGIQRQTLCFGLQRGHQRSLHIPPKRISLLPSRDFHENLGDFHRAARQPLARRRADLEEGRRIDAVH